MSMHCQKKLQGEIRENKQRKRTKEERIEMPFFPPSRSAGRRRRKGGKTRRRVSRKKGEQ